MCGSRRRGCLEYDDEVHYCFLSERASAQDGVFPFFFFSYFFTIPRPLWHKYPVILSFPFLSFPSFILFLRSRLGYTLFTRRLFYFICMSERRERLDAFTAFVVC